METSVCWKPLSRAGGVRRHHGDELCGVYLPGGSCSAAGPRGGTASARRVLGSPPVLGNATGRDTPYEVRRAQELNAQLGPRGSEEATDLVCDLHNTTANMGVCVIAHQSDWVSLHLFKYLQLCGVYLLGELQRRWPPRRDGFGSSAFSLTTVLGNPRAVDAGRRYTERDLNRCFTGDLLSEDTPYEVRRAQELNAQLGPRRQRGGTDLVCDLHNTTANMGVCVIAHQSDWVSLHLFKYLQREGCRPAAVRLILLSNVSRFSLSSLGKHGLGAVFDGGEVDAYVMVDKIDFPRDPETQETVCYEGAELYAFFVNEAAYYEKHSAMLLGHKERMLLPSISVKKEH
ncbi:hypothetical protein CRUP_031605 [Coryphaenoides rupestris]|nr:hypothetical protein CRUP_031605 [Coryphaenoides rupestris]